MTSQRRMWARAAGFAFVASLVAAVGVPTTAGAAPSPMFPQCPAAGPDTGCGTLITINGDGSTSLATDPSQPALDRSASNPGGTGVLVGIVNNSNANDTSITLSGPGAFTLTGKGFCTVHPTPCFSSHEYGPTGYEGPGTTLVPSTSSAGTVNFTGGISPGGGTYFSLSGSPLTVTSVALVPGLDVTADPLSPSTSEPFSGAVASFYVGTSLSPSSEFSATVNWGDGSTTGATIVQPDGPGTAYEVDAAHTYTASGHYTDTVTVTDSTVTSFDNSASDSAAVSVVTRPVVLVPVAIPDPLAGTVFSGEVATFTSPVPTAAPGDFAVTLDWGNGQVGSGSVSQPGGTGTVFDVSGSNTYATSGEYTITVRVTYADVTTMGTVPIVVDAAQTTVPCIGSCSAGVTTPLETSTASTSYPGGSLSVSLANGSLTCASPTPYDYAPQITTVTTEGIPSTTTVKVHVTFKRSDLRGPAGAPVQVCFAWSHPFTVLGGGTAQPQVINGQNYYVGLLPYCTSSVQHVPCRHKPKPLPKGPKVGELIKFPAGDPRFH